MFHRIVCSAIGCAAAAFTTGASAQTSFDWSGFYVGLNAGHAWGDDQTVRVPPTWLVNILDVPNVGLEGFFGGGQAGYLVQTGPFVLGLEGDIQLADIGDRESTQRLETAVGPLIWRASHELDWFGTARARAGIAFGRMLPYVTGGLAVAQVELKHITDWNFAPNRFTTVVLEDDEISVGFSVGGGIELTIRDRWSVKLEYQYLDFGSASAAGIVTAPGIVDPPEASLFVKTNDIDAQLQTIRIGGNLRF